MIFACDHHKILFMIVLIQPVILVSNDTFIKKMWRYFLYTHFTCAEPENIHKGLGPASDQGGFSFRPVWGGGGGGGVPNFSLLKAHTYPGKSRGVPPSPTPFGSTHVSMNTIIITIIIISLFYEEHTVSIYIV